MYGAEEFEEDDDFISFVKSDIEQKVKQIASTNSGVNLDMNFIVNTDAEMKLIFDNNKGDQIQARGFGSLNLKLDPFYNLSLTGKYEISEGSKYDFALGNFKQPFDIVSGSTIKWNGDILDAELSKRLLIAIFNKHSPLHDGAVIIHKGKIKAARCILPVTEREVPAQFGLRHRAGIGMSEATDALILVISEETGQISMAKNGKVLHNLSFQEVREIINDYLNNEDLYDRFENLSEHDFAKKKSLTPKVGG